MKPPYCGCAGVHIAFGLFSICAGITWIVLLHYFEGSFMLVDGSKVPIPSILPKWAIVLLAAKIWCGFWFFLTGVFGACIRRRGCTEGMYVALNVLNVIIWAPVLMLIMAATFALVYYLPDLLKDQLNGESIALAFSKNMWLYLFLLAGAITGVVEFIHSIVSYSVVCCCKPEALSFESGYQYEMK